MSYKNFFKIAVGDVRHVKLVRDNGLVEAFGKKAHEWTLEEKGQEYYYTPTPKVHDEFLSHGAGARVILDKKEFVTKAGMKASSINVFPDNGSDTVAAAEKVFAPQEEPHYVRDYSNDPEANMGPDAREKKLGRGQCLNLAFQFTLHAHPEIKDFDTFMLKAEAYAERMTERQSKFINGII